MINMDLQQQKSLIDEYSFQLVDEQIQSIDQRITGFIITFYNMIDARLREYEMEVEDWKFIPVSIQPLVRADKEQGIRVGCVITIGFYAPFKNATVALFKVINWNLITDGDNSSQFIGEACYNIKLQIVPDNDQGKLHIYMNRCLEEIEIYIKDVWNRQIIASMKRTLKIGSHQAQSPQQKTVYHQAAIKRDAIPNESPGIPSRKEVLQRTIMGPDSGDEDNEIGDRDLFDENVDEKNDISIPLPKKTVARQERQSSVLGMLPTSSVSKHVKTSSRIPGKKGVSHDTGNKNGKRGLFSRKKHPVSKATDGSKNDGARRAGIENNTVDSDIETIIEGAGRSDIDDAEVPVPKLPPIDPDKL
jgi:hypothetical protein